jgi:hypothetical protein
MEPLSTTVVAACAAMTASALALVLSEHRLNTWRAAAACLDHWFVNPFGDSRTLEGERDGFGVTFRRFRSHRLAVGTRIIIDGRRRIAGIPDLRAEGAVSTVDRALGVTELQVGDPGFDAEVFAQGPEDVLLPLLNHEARLAVRALVALGGRVSDGTVRIDLSTSHSVKPIAAALAAGLRAASCLRERSDAVGRLIENAQDDPCPEFRRRCLELLARRHAGDPRARDAFRALLRSRNPALRLGAAIPLATEGHETLAALAADPSTPEPIAVRAIDAMGERLSAEHAAAGLEAALSRGRTQVALAWVGSLGRVGGSLAITRLSSALLGDPRETAVAAAAALAATGDPAAEPALIRALGSGHPELRVASAEALAVMGTTRAVAALHRAAQFHPSSELARATRQAIAAIQARLPGASPGQVSLADAESGQLSLTHRSDSGRLSVTNE